jgi:hypothetical protein
LPGVGRFFLFFPTLGFGGFFTLSALASL